MHESYRCCGLSGAASSVFFYVFLKSIHKRQTGQAVSKGAACPVLYLHGNSRVLRL